jgi:protein ImuB
MQKFRVTASFAVIYVPRYRLQCALLGRVFSRAFQGKKSAEIFSSTVEAFAGHPEIGSQVEMYERVPAALLDADGKRVIELNPPAEAAGIPLSASTGLAVARVPELLCLPRMFSWEARLQDALLQLAYRHSPLLQNTAPGVCTLDLRMRRDADHTLWLRDLLNQLRQLGLKAKAGLGANPEVALQAARIADPLLEITGDRASLRALPLECLQPSPEMMQILRGWGVHTVGALMRLPREAAGRRLGTEGLSLWDRAAGRSPQVLRYVRPSERFLESVELEYQVETLEPLLFLLRRFLERLCIRITAAYRLVAGLHLRLNLEGQNPLVRTLQIPAPTCEVEALFRITSQYLETVRTTAPILGFELEAKPSDPGNHQFDLYRGGLKEPNRFFQTLARLAALIGNDRVGIPEPVDTYRPDSVRLRWPDGQWGPSSSWNDPAPRIGPAFRRCRPGVPAGIRLEEGRPIHIQSSLVTGHIQEVRGPWKLSGDWWDQSFWAVEEWDIQLQKGALYRLAHEEDQWQVVGIYD